MTSRRDLSRLLRPRSIAFVGGRSIVPAIHNAERLGFRGEVHVVNPTVAEIAGYRTVPSIGELPTPIDAAFVAVRRELAIDAVRELAAVGAGGCVCLAAGFAEVGPEGAALQAALVEAAGPDLPVVGPNCYGVLNLLDGVALWPDLHGGVRVDRGVGIVAQSGNISLNVTAADRSIPLGVVISAGNQAVLRVADLLDALLEDERVPALGCYLEGLGDEDQLSGTLARARDAGVPVVAIAAGASTAGARLAATHTGSLADTEQPARLAAMGASVVASLPELLESLKLLATWRSAGRGLVALGASGGDLSLFAAQAEAVGLRFPPLPDNQRRRLAGILGPLATVDNPLDTSTAVWGDRTALEACFTTAMDGPADATVLLLDVPPASAGDLGPWDVSVEAFVAAHERTGHPAAVVSSLPEGLPAATRERLLAGGVVPLQGMREAAVALDVAAGWLSAPGDGHPVPGVPATTGREG